MSETLTGRTRLRAARVDGSYAFSDGLALQVEIAGQDGAAATWRDATIQDITVGVCRLPHDGATRAPRTPFTYEGGVLRLADPYRADGPTTA